MSEVINKRPSETREEEITERIPIKIVILKEYELSLKASVKILAVKECYSK